MLSLQMCKQWYKYLKITMLMNFWASWNGIFFEDKWLWSPQVDINFDFYVHVFTLQSIHADFQILCGFLQFSRGFRTYRKCYESTWIFKINVNFPKNSAIQFQWNPRGFRAKYLEKNPHVIFVGKSTWIKENPCGFWANQHGFCKIHVDFCKIHMHCLTDHDPPNPR